jgi:hypothetical protein
MMRSGDVRGLGEGGAGEFVGGGGMSAGDESAKKYSEASSVESTSVDSDDSVKNEGREPELLLRDKAGIGTIVLFRGRGAKRPLYRGWSFQASVADR